MACRLHWWRLLSEPGSQLGSHALASFRNAGVPLLHASRRLWVSFGSSGVIINKDRSNAVSFACMAAVLLNAARFDGRSCINSPLPSIV